MPKLIEAVVRKGTNYIFHILAAGRIGFESDYASQYASFVKPQHLRYLESQRPLLTFADGHTGALVGLLVFWPAYMDLDSSSKLADYYQLLGKALQTGDYTPLLSCYREEVSRLNSWVQRIDERWLAGHKPYLAVIEQLGQIFVESFAAYEESVWPQEKEIMQSVAERICDFFRARDVIGAWEQLTNREFKFPGFEIIPCSAIAKGPDANSLGYEKVVFYSGSDFAYITDFISHEVGTHILIDCVSDLIQKQGDSNFDLLYQSYESLARFYNSLILGEESSYALYGRRGDSFVSIFADIHAQNRAIRPEDLLSEGTAVYQERFRKESDPCASR